jgi:Tfp pilus assembly protein PilF
MVDTELADYYATCAADATREGNYAKAEYYLDLALDEDPHSILAHSNLGVLYSILGMWQKAIQVYQKALRHAPDNALLLYNLGTSHMETGDFQQAVACLEQAVEKNDSVQTERVFGDLGLDTFS